MSNTLQQPLVSICLLTYNQERVIGQTLASLLAQTYPRLEILVLDDASTDGTGAVVRALADARVRHLRNEKNLGEYFNLNHGIAQAAGDYLAIYHGDDVYAPTIVAEQAAYLQAHPASAAVFCLANLMDEQGKIFGALQWTDELPYRDAVEYDQVFRFFLRHNNALLVTPTAMLRRAVLHEIGSFDAARYGSRADLDLWIRILRRYPVGVLNRRLIDHRLGKDRNSARYRRLRTDREMVYAIMDRYIDMDGWREKASAMEMTEYAFHVCDDETFRAANFVILGNPRAARELLKRPFPWQTFRTRRARRKFRVVLLRAAMRVMLALRQVRALKQILIWTEYQGQLGDA